MIESTTILKEQLDKLYRDQAKLQALEAGGVDNWDHYDDSLADWYKENELQELMDEFIENLNDILVDAKVEEPAGQGCGHSITFDESKLRGYLSNWTAKAIAIDKE